MRRFWRAQQTVLSWLGADVRPLGFYIPYRYAGGVRAPSPNDSVAWLEAKLTREAPGFESFLERASKYNERLKDFAKASETNPNQPRFNQEWFPGLDATIAYAIVREFKPKRIIEIGSGHSTRFLAQAIKDAGLATELHSIDPEPRKEIDAICAKITRATVEGVDRAVFRELERGDILFIDCSHIAMPGSDVDYLFTQVLPELAPGVVVHVHDIFLPHGYPPEWAWRSYNEQGMLAAMLGGGARYEIVFPVAFMLRHFSEACRRVYAPQMPNTFPASFWIQVR